METKTTPGPWVFKKIEGYHELVIGPADPEKPGFLSIAVAHINSDGAQAKANACLIAAAPDMLEALKRIRDAHYECLIDGKCNEKEQFCIPCVTRFAIAKAEGR